MSKSSYNLSENVGKVRLYSRDINVNNAALTDAEWDVLIAAVPSSNLRLAAAWGLRIIAQDVSKLERWRDAGVDANIAVTNAVEMAEWLEGQAESVDGISGSAVLAAIPWMAAHSESSKEVYTDDTDWVKPKFTRNLHVNQGDLNGDGEDD